MRLSLSAKQTAGVTALIALSMTAMSAQYLARLARVGLEDSRGSGELLGRIIYERSREALAGAADPRTAIRDDRGIRSILESTAAYGRDVTYAAIVDQDGVAIAHSFRALEGQRLEPTDSLSDVLHRNTVGQIQAIYADRPLEVVMPLELGQSPFGAIRIGYSPVLIRSDLRSALGPIVWATMLISGIATLVGLVLARRILRPIHVLSSGLMRLRRGETGVTIDLPQEDELEGLGESFNAIGEQLAARPKAVRSTRIESLMAGVTHEVKNPLNAMTIHLELVRQHLRSAEAGRPDPRTREPVHASAGAVLGLSAEVPIATSRDHLEVIEAIDGAREHLDVISSEIHRLDEVIQGFVRFIRPQELQLQPVDVQALMDEVVALVNPEARRHGVSCRAIESGVLPELRADAALLRQALLNLALNGCQAMPDGGKLTMAAKAGKGGATVLMVEDTGAGIPADQLERIFDLYYTTKPGGDGIGLSMVYRIAQLHGGEIEVESIIGRGSAFRILLPPG